MRATGEAFQGCVVVPVAIVGLLSTIPFAATAAPGNSGAAHGCQPGRWQDFGTDVRNTGKCVTYSAYATPSVGALINHNTTLWLVASGGSIICVIQHANDHQQTIVAVA